MAAEMETQIMAYATKYFYIIMILVGLVLMVGCIRDWKWVTRMTSPSKWVWIRTWLEEMYGIEARYRFERAVTFVCSAILVLAGMVYAYLLHV